MADRRRARSLREQVLPLRPLLAVWAAGLLVLGLVVAQQRVPQRNLLLDPVSSADLPWYTGLVSNIGILVWCVAATAAASTAWVARAAGRPRAARCFAQAAAIGVLLLLDDLLLLHSEVLPRFVPLPKVAIELSYGVLFIAWVAANRAELRRTRAGLLAAAGGALAASVAVDALGDPSVAALVAEDGAKLLGILAWATYFVASGRDIVMSALGPTARVPAGTGGRPTG